MSFFSELRQRRIFQIVATFAAAGWLVLEGSNSLIERGILPEITYHVLFVWYLGGLLGSLVVGWYHGEKGRQEVSRTETAFLAGIGLVVLFMTGSTIASEVGSSEVGGAGLDLRRLAVLYFEDASRDSTEAYLADALSEGLMDELATVQSLEVVSRNGVLPFRGRDVDYDSIARTLQAGILVDGAVEASRDQVRVDVRLIDGASGAVITRTRVEERLERSREAIGSLAREVALELRPILGEEIQVRATAAGTERFGAWRLYQQAERLRKEAQARIDAHDADEADVALRMADSLFAAAQEADPSWPEPWVGRAEIARTISQRVEERAERAAWIEEGLGHARQALDMAPAHAKALELRGTLRYFQWWLRLTQDPAGQESLLRSARQDLERAVQLDPELASAHAMLSNLYYQPSIADLPSAALAARAAYEADAFLRNAEEVLARLFATFLDMGQFSQAAGWCEEGGRRFPGDPRFSFCRLYLMTTPGTNPDPDMVWSVVERLEELLPEHGRDRELIRARFLAGAALARASLNRESDALADSARSVLERAHAAYEEIDDPRRELLGLEAYGRHVLGDDDAAIDLLKVYATLNHGFQAGGDLGWMWRDLRNHPRFREVVTRSAEGH